MYPPSPSQARLGRPLWRPRWKALKFRVLLRSYLVFASVLPDANVEAQTLHFLHQHVERLGRPRFERVVTLDDGLVNPRAALHVVTLDSKQLLQRVCAPVGLHGPDFHFTEALAAILRLAAERLLRDQRVRTNCARVNLVRHEMAQLQHIDVADNDLLIKWLTCPTVKERRLAVLFHPRIAINLPGLIDHFVN